MAAAWLIILVGLAVQLTLATFTARDAHSRGHDRDIWFVLVLIFGIFAILVYLLTRNDRRIPESERPPKQTNSRLSNLAVYSGAVIAGIVLFAALGMAAGNVIHPVPDYINWDECDSISVDYSNANMVAQDGTDYNPSDPCTVSRQQWENYNQARNSQGTTLFLSIFLGMVLTPAGVYAWRRDRD